MDRAAAVYALAAIAVPSAATAACLLAGSDRTLLVAIELFCVYPILCLALYMWMHGAGFRWLNIGESRRPLTEDEKKGVASRWGAWMVASMIVLCLSMAVLLDSLVLGFALMAVGVVLCLVPLKDAFRAWPVPSMTLGKRIAAFAAASLLAVAPPVAISMSEHSAAVTVELGEDSVVVKGPMFDHEFRYDEIGSCELFEDFQKGSRLMGYADGSVCSGRYSNDLFGRYDLASYAKVKPCVALSVDGKMYAFNRSTAEATLELYDALKERLPSHR